MDEFNIVISHPGRKHWRWELLKDYKSGIATGDVHSLRDAWDTAVTARAEALRLGL